MPKPEYSFELESPADLLAKARRELTQLTRAQHSLSEMDSVSDHAFNCAITIWHIADWIWKLYNPNNTKNLQCLGLKDFNDLHSLIRRESEAMAICYEIATGSKHMKLDKKPDYKPQVAATEVSDGPSTILATGIFKVLKVDLRNGKRKRAEDIFKEAIEYWEKFFATYKIS